LGYNKTMISIHILAPTPALRAGLRALVSGPEIQVTGESASIEGPITSDVLLVAGEYAPAAFVRLVANDGALAIVLLADDGRAANQLRDLPLRGWAIVSPDGGESELSAAITAAAIGFVVLPRELAPRLVGRQAVLEAGTEALTNREQEILQLIGQGLPNKQIAGRLQISEHTVKFHVSSIFAKLGAASRTEAVSLGARQGLITL
jgi:DNA-binding NarL/FixJ family response regulator